MNDLTSRALAALDAGADFWDFNCGLMLFATAASFLTAPYLSFYVTSATYGVCGIAAAAA